MSVPQLFARSTFKPRPEASNPVGTRKAIGEALMAKVGEWISDFALRADARINAVPPVRTPAA